MGKAQRHADPVPSGTVMQEGGETADPGGSGTDRKDADEPAEASIGAERRDFRGYRLRTR
ncbi:hypothetical protein VQ056_04540 [Paenibacillus sp. JTLBN-2024]